MGIIAVILAPFTFLINYFFSIRRSRRLVEWMKMDAKGKPIEEELWHDAREAAIKLPRLSGSFSLILWPSAMLILAVVMLLLGRFGLYQAIVTAVSGLLIGPLNALSFFYALRSDMNKVLKKLSEYPVKPRDVDAPMTSLRFKLVFSYTCLVICPMLFAVILDRHQGDKLITEQRCEHTRSVLSHAAQTWGKSHSSDSVEWVFREGSIPNAEFFAVDRSGTLLVGSPSARIKNLALEHVAEKRTGTLYLHQADRYLTITAAGDGDIFLLGAFHRLSETRGFWGRNWLIIALLIGLGVIGVGLGLEASRDTMTPVGEMMRASQGVNEGDFTVRGVFLNDDELGVLGEVFNKLIADISEQLEMSSRMVDDIRSVIVRLGKETEEVYNVVAKQRLGVGDQMLNLDQAQSVSGQITDAARSIQEKSASIREMTEKTSSDCGTGRSVLGETSAGMRLIGDSMDEISNRMNELVAHFESIVEVVEMIDEVSERTNLLAMNASLEAVGAGRAGKRFAVVAQEVRRLADKTTQSTAKIRSLFSAISESSKACVGTVDGGQTKVAYGLDMMERLRQNFEEISMHAETTGESVAQIHLMTTQQTTAAMQMQDTIAEVADAGKTVEKGADVTDESVRSLNKLTGTLQGLVGTEKKS